MKRPSAREVRLALTFAVVAAALFLLAETACLAMYRFQNLHGSWGVSR